jgi:hypothetical protein
MSVLELIFSKYPHTGPETKYNSVCSTRLGFIFILKNLKLILTQPFFTAGKWSVPHSLALFEDSDVLCVANREGQEVSCMRAGLFSYPAKDVTGTQVTNYKNMGRVYAIAEKGIVVFHSFQITRSFYLLSSNTYVT